MAEYLPLLNLKLLIELERISIKNWAEDDRPREKLLKKGKDSLSTAELIAILLGSGSRSESAVELAKRLFSTYNNSINQLAKCSLIDLQKFKGIGEAKAITIAAALELSRRRESEKAIEKKKIQVPKDTFNLMKPIIGDLSHEEVWMIYLNSNSVILSYERHTVGGISVSATDVRLIMKRALELYATSLVIVHNHPSGKLIPSQQDVRFTQKMMKAGKVFDIGVLDHVIIAGQKYFSFLDEKYFYQ